MKQNKFKILIFNFALFSSLFAGAPDTLWTRTYGGADIDFGWSVQQTNDGGFVIIGSTESSGAGLSDVYLIRTDSDGDTLWTRTYGGTDHEHGNSIQQVSDGGFIIVGNTGSFSVDNYNIYLIRIDQNGDTLWTKTYGGVEFDEGESVRHTNDDGFIIAGWTSHASGESYVDLIKTDYNMIIH